MRRRSYCLRKHNFKYRKIDSADGVPRAVVFDVDKATNGRTVTLRGEGGALYRG